MICYNIEKSLDSFNYHIDEICVIVVSFFRFCFFFFCFDLE